MLYIYIYDTYIYIYVYEYGIMYSMTFYGMNNMYGMYNKYWYLVPTTKCTQYELRYSLFLKRTLIFTTDCRIFSWLSACCSGHPSEAKLLKA